MAESLTQTRLVLTLMMLRGLSMGVIWGASAGAIIGIGISLDIGLFSSSAAVMVYAVILTAALMGALFGHIIICFLSEEEMGVISHAPGLFHHQFADPTGESPVTDYQGLKADALNNSIISQDIMEIIHSMRTTRAFSERRSQDARIMDTAWMDSFNSPNMATKSPLHKH